MRVLAPITVFGVIFVILAATLIMLFWKIIVACLIALAIAKGWHRHHELHRPVPWDDNYRPEDDDDIPY